MFRFQFLALPFPEALQLIPMVPLNMLPEKNPKRAYATKGYNIILSRYPKTYTTPSKTVQVRSGGEIR